MENTNNVTELDFISQAMTHRENEDKEVKEYIRKKYSIKVLLTFVLIASFSFSSIAQAKGSHGHASKGKHGHFHVKK